MLITLPRGYENVHSVLSFRSYTLCSFTFMGLDLGWNKGPRDFSKFASCNLNGNNINPNILPYA